jgi:alanine racemase
MARIGCGETPAGRGPARPEVTQTVGRPIRATVHCAALSHNYAVARRAAPKSLAYAVVKANGYGHGAWRVAQALSEADGFATLELDSAVQLRESGVAAPILMLEGVFSIAELREASVRALAIVVHDEAHVRWLETAELPAPLDVFLKINTGMNRLGFPAAAAHGVAGRLKGARNVRSLTLMTHFATADGEAGVTEAMARFVAATKGLAARASLANSAAILRHPDTHADIVRPGILLYGATPFADATAASLGLKPAMTLASELIAVQELAAGESVGYGATFRAERAMRIGAVACGYADGYPRAAPTGTPVAVAGVRTRTVGRVSMDMIMVDLGPVPAARVGTPVELWGAQVPIDEVATGAGTVGYELMCALAPRVPVTEA